MQHVADDLLGVLQRLFPRHLDGGCRDRLSLHALWRTGQPICPQDRQASTGLRGAGAVLGNALVDGFIRLVDPIDGESAAWGHERDKHLTERSAVDVPPLQPCQGPRTGSCGRASHVPLFPQKAFKKLWAGAFGEGKAWEVDTSFPRSHDWADYLCLNLQRLWFKYNQMGTQGVTGKSRI